MSVGRITTRIAPVRALATQVSVRSQSFVLGAISRPIAVTQVSQGLTGAPASAGQAQISEDPGNLLRAGSDQKLFVPDGAYDFDGLVAATLIV